MECFGILIHMLNEFMNIGIGHYLFVSGALFIIGLLGVLLRKNIFVILMSIELMLLSVNINFIAFSSYLNDIQGQVFVFFILTVAAAEAAIGLAILVVIFRQRKSLEVDELKELKG